MLKTLGRAMGAFLAVFIVTGCTELSYKMGIADCAPAYGNWCGENYPTTGFTPRPVDTWDRACRAHDLCYDAGGDKLACDREFLDDLERAARSRIIPQAMLNAHSWFTNDGHFGGFQSVHSMFWAASADCDGGDGESAKFFCQTIYGPCPLSPTAIPGGRQGMWACQCNGVPGQIGEM